MWQDFKEWIIINANEETSHLSSDSKMYGYSNYLSAGIKEEKENITSVWFSSKVVDEFKVWRINKKNL